MTHPASTTDDAAPGRRRGNDLAGLGSEFASSLAGRRVLVAEDNVILSMHVAEALESAGAEVLGPYPFATEAMAALETERPDAAVLDHELMDGTSAQVADRLGTMGVPFAFFTSHPEDHVPGDAPVLQKPNEADALLGMVSGLL